MHIGDGMCTCRSCEPDTPEIMTPELQAQAESVLRMWWGIVRPHPHRHGEYLMLTVEVSEALGKTHDLLSQINRRREGIEQARGSSETEDCAVCGGEGRIEDTDPYNRDEYEVAKCYACGGTGDQKKRPKGCHGCGAIVFSDGLRPYCMNCGLDRMDDLGEK